jgi:hypothetical protein
MKYILLLLVSCGLAHAQEFSLSSAFHVNGQSSYVGGTLSANVMTWNNRKVMLRGVLSYLSGTTTMHGAGSQSAQRIEIGVESKNTMITGKWLFNVMDASYAFCSSTGNPSRGMPDVRESGFMFGLGLGTRIAAPVSLVGKYVTGRDNGFRMVMEVDF